MIYLLAIFILLVLVYWLDRMARAQEVAALVLIRLYAGDRGAACSCHSPQVGARAMNPFKPGDRVVNSISPSAVGVVVDAPAREGFVRVHFDGHGEPARAADAGRGLQPVHDRRML
jgi:hypothetical protein